jgi:hypothetical protein
MKKEIITDLKWEEAGRATPCPSCGFMMKAMMRQLGRMFIYSVCLLCSGYAAVNAYAQSFIIAVSGDETMGSTVIAGRPHLMTVTRDSGSGTDTAYTGSHTLTGWYTDVGTTGATAPELCAPNVGDNCAPAGACQSVTTVHDTTLPAFTFASGVAKFCLVMPDVGIFSVGMSEAAVEGSGPALTSRPDHFSLTGLRTNRSDLACPGSTFTYMGEPIGVTFELTAKNQANVTTPHYSGARFASDITLPATWTTHGVNDSMGLWMVATGHTVGAGSCTVMFSNATPSVTSFDCTVGNPASINRAAGPRVTISPTPAVPSVNWANGVGTYNVNVILERADAPDGAYGTLRIGVAPRDADGVVLDVLNMDADNDAVNERASVGATILRYGRLRIANTYGSELLPLPVEVQAQFWNGSAYTSNTDDGCTPLAGGNFANSLGPGAVISTSIGGIGTLTGGTGKITLAKPSPSPTAKGAVNVTSVIPYLPGTGRATFGVYRSGPVIYRRELHY